MSKCLTNAPHVAKWLNRKCPGDHHHVALIGGRAKACEIYPTKLCEAIVQGLKDQLVEDERRGDEGSLMNTVHDEGFDERWDEFTDDLSGKPMRSDLVKVARREEI